MPKVQHIVNWINGRETHPSSDVGIDKYDPNSGLLLSTVGNSQVSDVQDAVSSAYNVFTGWAEVTPIRRGQILADIVSIMKARSDELVECVAAETGKPAQDAVGEVRGAILQGEYWAGEGMRLYGRSLTSSTPGKHCYTQRQPRGVAALIVPANTPLANIAWKAFPALLCGNTAVMKAAEDSPRIALLFARLTKEAGLPDGVFNVIQGSGQIAGAALVEDPRVAVISFTGSTAVGRWIAEVGGKNPFVVCDDADLDQAVHWAALSAFSNAGQRCSAGSRILVFRDIYSQFRDMFVAKADSLKLGTSAGCDLGPVINKRQKQSILDAIAGARSAGGSVICGGAVPAERELSNGYYIRPTIIEGLCLTNELIRKEVFGPVVTMHPVADLSEALIVANDTEYGLTAAIHTPNINRALWFANRVRAGVVNVNLGTFGSEPHMPFGGFGASGNGTREPGIEALDVYTEIKNISLYSAAKV